MCLLQPNRTAAEAAAIRMWKQYGFTTPKDLELEVLAFERGVAVVEGPLQSADARLVRKGRRAVLRSNRAIVVAG